MTRLITTIAGFIRMFPDVALMDDSLASWARTAHDRHLPPVMITLAKERQVLEQHSAVLVLRLAELAQNIGQQGVKPTAQMDKADAVTVKGQFNLLGLVAGAASFAAKGLMLGMLADAGAEISKEFQFGIHAAHFLRDAQEEVLAFVENGPAYLKTALEAAISDVTDPDLPPLPPVKPQAEMPVPPVKP